MFWRIRRSCSIDPRCHRFVVIGFHGCSVIIGCSRDAADITDDPALAPAAFRIQPDYSASA
jgi:hypothetical protein